MYGHFMGFRDTDLFKRWNEWTAISYSTVEIQQSNDSSFSDAFNLNSILL